MFLFGPPASEQHRGVFFKHGDGQTPCLTHSIRTYKARPENGAGSTNFRSFWVVLRLSNVRAYVEKSVSVDWGCLWACHPSSSAWWPLHGQKALPNMSLFPLCSSFSQERPSYSTTNQITLLHNILPLLLPLLNVHRTISSKLLFPLSSRPLSTG